MGDFFLVPEVGIEPTSLARHDFKSCAYTNSATRAFHFYLEAWVGIAPTYKSFADSCLTTWRPGRFLKSAADSWRNTTSLRSCYLATRPFI